MNVCGRKFLLLLSLVYVNTMCLHYSCWHYLQSCFFIIFMLYLKYSNVLLTCFLLLSRALWLVMEHISQCTSLIHGRPIHSVDIVTKLSGNQSAVRGMGVLCGLSIVFRLGLSLHRTSKIKYSCKTVQNNSGRRKQTFTPLYTDVSDSERL